MRKLKKSLALILTVCILCAATLVSAFADSASTSQLNVATDDGMIVNYAATTTDYSSGFANLASATDCIGTGSSNILKKSNTNGYLQLKSVSKKSVTTNSPYFYFPFESRSANETNKYGVMYNDYAVVDYDICADSYVDSEGNLTTDAYTNGVKNKLAYPANMIGSVAFRTGSATTANNSMNIEFMYDASMGHFIRQFGATIDLPDEINVWTHITYVFEIDNSVNYVDKSGETILGEFDPDEIDAINAGTSAKYSSYSYNLSKSKVHIYANGEWKGSYSNFMKDGDKDGVTDVNASTYWYANGGEVKDIDKFGLYQMQFHPKTDVASEISFGFDNMAYNLYRNGYSGDLAKHIKYNTKAPIYNCNDVVCKSTYDMPAGTPTASIVYECVDGALTLVKEYDIANGAVANAADGQYVILTKDLTSVISNDIYVHVPDGVNFTTATDSAYALRDSADTVTATLNGEEYTFKKVEAPSYATTDANGIVKEYKFNPDEMLGDFKAQEPIKLLSDFNSINVVDSNGEVYSWIAANATGDKFNLPFGSTEASGKFSIDVNGHTLNLSNLNATPAISVNQNCKVDIFSSDVGGHIICTNDTFLRGNDFGGAKVTLGTKGDKCGENAKLTITANALFSTTQNVRNLNDNEATFTVYGINYKGIGTKESHTAVYVAWNTRVNIYDSYFDIPNEGASFLGCMNNPGTNKNHGVIDAYVENTTVVAAGDIIARLGDYSFGSITEAYKCEATFNKCVLSGNITPIDDALEEARRGTVYLEGGTKLLTSETITSDKVVASVGFVLAKATEETFNYVALAANSENLSTLTFNGGEAEYWYAGSALPTGEDGEKFELYYEKFAGWTDGETVYTVAPAGTYALTSAQTVIVNIPNIKLNLTANNGFIVNYYVPASYGVTADAKSAGTTEKGGIVYDIYTVAGISPNNVEGATIVLTLNVDSVDYTQEITVSLLDYFGAILAGEDDEAKTLVVNAVNYCNAVYNYVNGEVYEAYTDILEENAERIIPADAESVTVNAKEQNVFENVQFIISEGNVPMFAFTKLTAGKVSVKFTNIYGDPIEIICTEVEVEGTVYYAVAEMPVYEMVDSFEVYVDDAKVGNYSIANYKEATEDADAKAIAEALYGYGVAVKNWKIED